MEILRDPLWNNIRLDPLALALLETPVVQRLRYVRQLGLAFLVSFGVAAYHAGAEWKFWPGPAACASGGGGVSASDMTALLQGAKMKPPACDQAAWVFLGLSMAGWNALVSLKLTLLSILALRRERKAP